MCAAVGGEGGAYLHSLRDGELQLPRFHLLARQQAHQCAICRAGCSVLQPTEHHTRADIDTVALGRAHIGMNPFSRRTTNLNLPQRNATKTGAAAIKSTTRAFVQTSYIIALHGAQQCEGKVDCARMYVSALHASKQPATRAPV